MLIDFSKGKAEKLKRVSASEEVTATASAFLGFKGQQVPISAEDQASQLWGRTTEMYLFDVSHALETVWRKCLT